MLASHRGLILEWNIKQSLLARSLFSHFIPTESTRNPEVFGGMGKLACAEDNKCVKQWLFIIYVILIIFNYIYFSYYSKLDTSVIYIFF